jgi:hypothetical protein
MRKVFLLTGFQNWGKTWLIGELFSRQRFYKDALYDFAGCSFCVMPKSNDDFDKEGYEADYKERMDILNKSGIQPKYIFSAFCPTKEDWNQSIDILHNLYSQDQIILIPIEYKWCGHARLQLKEIEQYYSAVKNLRVQPLSQKDSTKKLQSLQEIVLSCLP